MGYIPIFDSVVYLALHPVVYLALDCLSGVVCIVQEIRSHDEQREGQDAPLKGLLLLYKIASWDVCLHKTIPQIAQAVSVMIDLSDPQ